MSKQNKVVLGALTGIPLEAMLIVYADSRRYPLL